jgi:beta-mannanase
MWYRTFANNLLEPYQEELLLNEGVTPMVSWEPVGNGSSHMSFARIAAGDYDSYLTRQARIAAAWGRPLYIRLAHEMNIPANPWGAGEHGDTAVSFIAAWRHIVMLFRDAAATNVRWVWSPNVNCSGACPFDKYYPGDAYVDWVGLDGYNFAGFQGHAKWTTLSQLFAGSYGEITRLTAKPLMIAEIASNPRGGNEAQWISHGFLDEIPQQLPRVRGVVWWDYESAGVDWQVNSSPSSLAAWREVVSSPLYGGARQP